MKKSRSVGTSRLDPPEEQATLQTTRELISRLEIHDLNPQSVIARGALTLDPEVEKDQLILPLSLYDKLNADEWKPLIASKLIYHRNFTKGKMLVAFSYQVFPYLTILSVIPLSILGLPVLSPLAASGLILLQIVVGAAISRPLYAPFFRRLQQTADRQTLELLGIFTLEEVLKKIATMNSQNLRLNKVIRRRIKDFTRPR